MEHNLSPLHSNLCFPSGTDVPRERIRRAVYRPAPQYFTIQFLPPSYVGSHNHGLRISPDTSESPSSSYRSLRWDYEIWRSWEDILYFQDTLESEYARAAREKKMRLAQGKGVKSINGFYKQDMASSWESLPPGPVPSSVARDIHKHLPRLAKKGSIFRPSRTTIDLRQKEFRSLIEALFSDDLPSLIQELREADYISNFFAFWRRDYEILDKNGGSNRKSLTSSMFSSYFPTPTPSLSSPSSTPSSTPPSSPPKSKGSSSRSNHSHSTSSSRSRSTTSTTSTVTSPELLIKAAHNSSIIMVRVPMDMPFDTILERIYNKFVGQEGVPLSKEFAVALVVPTVNRPRTLSVESSSSSMLSRTSSLSSTDTMELHFIDSQDDWEQVVLVKGGKKVTLKVLDAPRV